MVDHGGQVGSLRMVDHGCCTFSFKKICLIDDTSEIERNLGARLNEIWERD